MGRFLCQLFFPWIITGLKWYDCSVWAINLLTETEARSFREYFNRATLCLEMNSFFRLFLFAILFESCLLSLVCMISVSNAENHVFVSHPMEVTSTNQCSLL